MRDRDIALIAVLAWLWFSSRRAKVVLTGSWVWPVPNTDAGAPVVSQEFKSGHPGLDIMFRNEAGFFAPEGTPVIAARDGIVRVSQKTARGRSLVIDHEPGLATFYQHLDTSLVSGGASVLAGQRLGTMGIDPTDAQKVRHLHFEVWVNNLPVDPGDIAANPSWKRTTLTD